MAADSNSISMNVALEVDMSSILDADTVAEYQAQLERLLAAVSAADQYVDTGNNVSAGIGEGMKNYSFDGDAAVVSQNVVGAFSGTEMDMTAAGAQAATVYAGGISANAGAAATAASNMALGALNAIKANMNNAGSIGRNFSLGLASGISSGRSAVISAAVNVARSAAAAVRTELSIHSPSRVTREMGEYFDLGFIRGVEGMTPDIEDAIRAAVYVEPPAGAAYGGAREAAPVVRVSGPAMDYDALADAMDKRQLALYMNDRRMAQVMSAETARAQSGRNRSIALGYGK